MADRSSWLARVTDVFRAPKPTAVVVPSNQMDVVSQFIANRPVEPDSIDLRKMVDEGYRRNVIVYVCVNEIASSAAAPRVYLRDRKTQDEVEEHELLDLIARPYPGGSWYDLIEKLLIYQQVTGTGYLHKGRSGASQIVQLTAARPDRIQPVPDKQGNILYYEYKIEGGDKQRIEPQDLAAFRLPDPLNDFHGLSPLTVSAVFGDIDTAAATYLRDFFANGAMPMGLLKFKTPSVRREDRLRVQQEWNEQYGASEISPKNAGRWHNVGVIGGDVDYVPLGAEPAQLRLDAVWGMTESRLCATFGVPPAIVQAHIGLQFSTYSNQREARRSFWTETLVPIYRRIADGLTANLVSEYDEELELCFDLESIPELQEDLNQRAERASKLFLGGVASFNEARLLSDLEEAKTDFYAFPGTVTMVPKEDVESGKYFADAAESKAKAEDAAALKASQPAQPFGGAPGEKPPPFGKKPKPGEEPVPPKKPAKGEPPPDETQSLAWCDEHRGAWSYKCDACRERADALAAEDEHGLPFEVLGLGKIPPESEREIQRATETLERGFSEAVRESVAGSDLAALAAALARGDWRGAERAVDTSGYVRRYGAALADHLYAETGVALGLHYRHHAGEPRETHGPMSDARRTAKAALKGRWGDKIESRLKLEMKRIDKQARDVVRSQILSVVNGKAQAVTPASIVGHIGLTDRQRATVERARVRLLAEGKLKGNALEKDLDRLRVKLLRERAKGIADYETRLAHSLGRQAAWERLLAEGKLRGGRRHWHKEWVVNESEGTCGECMDLDGEDVPLDDAFSNGSVCPPEHPNCNCEIVLVETTGDWRRTKDAAPGADEALHDGWVTVNGHPVFLGGPDGPSAVKGGGAGFAGRDPKTGEAIHDHAALIREIGALGIKDLDDEALSKLSPAKREAMLLALRDGATLLKRQGIAVPKGMYVTFDKTDSSIYATATGTKELTLNAGNPAWRSPSAIASAVANDGAKGFLSGNTPGHLVVHEVGHLLHAASVDRAFVGSKAKGSTAFDRYVRANSSDPSHEASLAGKGVSRYARSANTEFVAEYFAGRVAGKSFSAAAKAHYDSLYGPPIGRLGKHSGEDGREIMTGSPCSTCVHFHAEDEERETCDAFPEGIPQKIAFGGSHDEHVEGDNGIKYEPLSGHERPAE